MQIKLEHSNFDYIISDALELDYCPTKTYVGNLPYNIGSRILLKCVASRAKQMIFLLQKEVVDKVCAPVGTGEYSSLSVLCQTYYKCKSGLVVGPKNFRPVPKVDSRLLICNRNEFDPDFDMLSKLLRICFHSPRKKMINNLGKVMMTELIDMNKRPFQITLAEYLELLKQFELL